MYNSKYMGSKLVEIGKTKNDVEYKIFNIDNIYTVYIQIDTQPNPETNVSEPIYSAIQSFPTLKEAQEYVIKN